MGKVRMTNIERNFEGMQYDCQLFSNKDTACLALFSNIALAFRNGGQTRDMTRDMT